MSTAMPAEVQRQLLTKHPMLPLRVRRNGVLAMAKTAGDPLGMHNYGGKASQTLMVHAALL